MESYTVTFDNEAADYLWEFLRTSSAILMRFTVEGNGADPEVVEEGHYVGVDRDDLGFPVLVVQRVDGETLEAVGGPVSIPLCDRSLKVHVY